MLRNLLASTHLKRLHTSLGKSTSCSNLNQSADATLDDLYDNSRSGLWGLLIFLGTSAFAFFFKEQSLAGSLPSDIMEQLGSTPSVILINCVFGASTLSSLISIAGRIYHEMAPGNTFTHLCFRVIFYLLYFISAALGDYFNMVFISGLVVLGLQHYNVWNYYMRAIETSSDKCSKINIYTSRLSKKQD